MKEWRKRFNKTFFSLFLFTNSEIMSENDPTFAEDGPPQTAYSA